MTWLQRATFAFLPFRGLLGLLALLAVLVGGIGLLRKWSTVTKRLATAGLTLSVINVLADLLFMDAHLRPDFRVGGNLGEVFFSSFQRLLVPRWSTGIVAQCAIGLVAVVILLVTRRRESRKAGDAAANVSDAGWLWASDLAIVSIAAAVAAIACDIPSVLVILAHRDLVRRDDVATAVGEALYVAEHLADRIAACADGGRAAVPGSPRALPPTSRAVPPNLPRGVAYRSEDSDWEDAAFRCADFRLPREQRFRYRWRRLDTAACGWETGGEVMADADLDGDGRVDQTVTVGVGCSRETCTVAPNALFGHGL